MRNNNIIIRSIIHTPAITRFIILITLILSLLTFVDALKPYHLSYSRFYLYKLQLHRLFTTFFYHGKVNYELILSISFLYRYSSMLEEHYHKKSDYFWLITVICSILLSIGSIFYIPFLASSLANTLTYIWTRKNPNAYVQIFGIFTFNAFYLPFIFPFVSISFEGKISTEDLLGIIVGQIAYFFFDVYPNFGSNFLTTPCWIHKLFNEEDECCKKIIKNVKVDNKIIKKNDNKLEKGNVSKELNEEYNYNYEKSDNHNFDEQKVNDFNLNDEKLDSHSSDDETLKDYNSYDEKLNDSNLENNTIEKDDCNFDNDKMKDIENDVGDESEISNENKATENDIFGGFKDLFISGLSKVKNNFEEIVKKGSNKLLNELNLNKSSTCENSEDVIENIESNENNSLNVINISDEINNDFINDNFDLEEIKEDNELNQGKEIKESDKIHVKSNDFEIKDNLSKQYNLNEEEISFDTNAGFESFDIDNYDEVNDSEENFESENIKFDLDKNICFLKNKNNSNYDDENHMEDFNELSYENEINDFDSVDIENDESSRKENSFESINLENEEKVDLDNEFVGKSSEENKDFESFDLEEEEGFNDNDLESDKVKDLEKYLKEQKEKNNIIVEREDFKNNLHDRQEIFSDEKSVEDLKESSSWESH